MKHTIQQVFQIYKGDIHNILTNWVVAVIIGGLIFLPSLYAWLNIYASMDPYAHTANMKIAIVNEDTGANVRGEDIHVGNDVIANLSTNKSFSWQFTSREKAIDHLKNGDYFAVIVIPSDFSQKLTSILSNQPTKAHIDYYVNEKINAVSPKITIKGASGLTQQVSSEFISTVNGTLFSIFNTIGVEMEREIPDLRTFENYIFTIEQHLPGIETFLAQTAKGGKEAETLLNHTITQVPEVEKLTNEGLTTIQQGLKLINEADTLFTELSPIIKKDLEAVQNIAQRFTELVGKLENANVDTATIAQTKDTIKKQLDASHEKINSSIQTLEALQKLTQADASTHKQLENKVQNILTALQQSNSEDVKTLLTNKKIIEQLEAIRGDLQANPSVTDYSLSSLTALNQLNTLLTDVSNKVQQLNNIDGEKIKKDLADVQSVAQNASNNLNQFLTHYNDHLEPQIRTTLSSAKNTLTNASSMLTNVKSFLPQVSDRLTNAKNTLATANKTIATVQSNFPALSTKIKDLAEKLRTLESEADISEIVQLLKNDVNAERDFFEEPIKLQEHRMFLIDNYGTAMTPFYTVLSIGLAVYY